MLFSQSFSAILWSIFNYISFLVLHACKDSFLGNTNTIDLCPLSATLCLLFRSPSTFSKFCVSSMARWRACNQTCTQVGCLSVSWIARMLYAPSVASPTDGALWNTCRKRRRRATSRRSRRLPPASPPPPAGITPLLRPAGPPLRHRQSVTWRRSNSSSSSGRVAPPAKPTALQRHLRRTTRAATKQPDLAIRNDSFPFHFSVCICVQTVSSSYTSQTDCPQSHLPCPSCIHSSTVCDLRPCLRLRPPTSLSWQL